MQFATHSAEHPAGWVGERRQEPRRRVLLQGKLVFWRQSFGADCMIRDLSAGGARIVLRDSALAPDPYLIVVREAAAHESITRWTLESQVGLSFSRSFDLGGEIPPHLQHLRRIWLELAPR